MTINASDILSVTKSVTREWTRQRRAEERGARSRSSRQYIYSDRVGFTEIAHDILPQGYAHASGNGTYTVDKRQFYYACREEFRKLTGREITAQYFSQNLLVKYMNRHADTTAHWKITASPRGTLTIPNAGYDLRIPCGTIAIEEHLEEAKKPFEPFDNLYSSLRVQWPSIAEGQRYQAVLYIEKEGFEPQLREAKIAERFDIAIISCKGQSVVAARRFVDDVCRVNGGVRLFVVHDLDKSGFEISQRLTSVSDHAYENDLVQYAFKNEIAVTDLGLRLADVEKYKLADEKVRFSGSFAADSIATKEEQAFLRSGRRVELNAFTAPQFIEWIESKLMQHLPLRLCPDEEVLEIAYRRAFAVAYLNQAIAEALPEIVSQARQTDIPRDLKRQVRAEMREGMQPWDKALYSLICE